MRWRGRDVTDGVSGRRWAPSAWFLLSLSVLVVVALPGCGGRPGTTAGTASTGESRPDAGEPDASGPASATAAHFFDDFPGDAVDPAKWTVFDRVSDQANGEVNCVAPQNVTVHDGLLEITSRHEDRSCGDTLEPPAVRHYTSGQVQQATRPFLYGTVEVRAKAPGGTGTWPAIWMLGEEWQASQPSTANVAGHDWPNGGGPRSTSPSSGRVLATA